MLNSMVVARERIGGLYSIILELPEKEYFEIYEDLDNHAAEDVLSQYMAYHGDDGRYSDVSIEHNKNSHIITIRASLHYEDNDHTEQYNTPHYFENKI